MRLLVVVTLVLTATHGFAQEQECGAEASYIAALALGAEIDSFGDYLADLGDPGEDGFSLSQMQETLEYHGLNVSLQQANRSIIERHLLANVQQDRAKVLPIVRLDGDHFVLLTGVTLDGFEGVDYPDAVLISNDELDRRRLDNYLMLVSNAEISSPIQFWRVVQWCSVLCLIGVGGALAWNFYKKR